MRIPMDPWILWIDKNPDDEFFQNSHSTLEWMFVECFWIFSPSISTKKAPEPSKKIWSPFQKQRHEDCNNFVTNKKINKHTQNLGKHTKKTAVSFFSICQDSQVPGSYCESSLAQVPKQILRSVWRSVDLSAVRKVSSALKIDSTNKKHALLGFVGKRKKHVYLVREKMEEIHISYKIYIKFLDLQLFLGAILLGDFVGVLWGSSSDSYDLFWDFWSAEVARCRYTLPRAQSHH